MDFLKNKLPISSTTFHSKPWGTGKARFLTSTECVQSLKDKERKKQKEAVQKALHFEERSQKKKPEGRRIVL